MWLVEGERCEWRRRRTYLWLCVLRKGVRKGIEGNDQALLSMRVMRRTH